MTAEVHQNTSKIGRAAMKGQLKVSDNQRFLTCEGGAPFFWLADTAWEMLHCLTREETEHYMGVRSKQGFNVLQTVILSEFDGLREPNAYGRVPLLKNTKDQYDPTMPDLSGEYSYFDHLDFTLECAERHDMYVALLPTWGDKFSRCWGVGPEIFTPENAYTYGEFLGARYKNTPNIVWVLGGDRLLEKFEHFDVIKNMADGIKNSGDTHLMTFHPMGPRTSGEQLHDALWLDFNMVQSGHGQAVSCTADMIASEYARQPAKPVVEGECNYEDYPRCLDSKNGWFDDTDVRLASYWAVFSGSFGITYGHSSVWSMCDKQRSYVKGNHITHPQSFLKSWEEALDSPGACQMIHIKNLILSKNFFDRIPANDDVLAEKYEGANMQCAVKGKEYIMVYCPNGIKTTVDLSIFNTKATAQWFDPRTGETIKIEDVLSSGIQSFTPPKSGRNNDYVLIFSKK